MGLPKGAKKVEWVPLKSLRPYDKNARKHDPDQLEKIAASIKAYGFNNPILIDADNVIVAGHGRYGAAHLLDLDKVPVVRLGHLTDAERRAYTIADNKLAEDGGWDEELLAEELKRLTASGIDLSPIGFSDADLERLLNDATGALAPEPRQQRIGSLAEQFGVPPFSVLSARDGWWQDRKRAWIALGIQSELGRGENLIGRSPQEVFCHATGMAYDKARHIVKEAMDAQGEAFSLTALIAAHGGAMPPSAIPGGVYRGKGFPKTGAVMPVSGGDVKAALIEKRGYASRKPKRQAV